LATSVPLDEPVVKLEVEFRLSVGVKDAHVDVTFPDAPAVAVTVTTFVAVMREVDVELHEVDELLTHGPPVTVGRTKLVEFVGHQGEGLRVWVVVSVKVEPWSLVVVMVDVTVRTIPGFPGPGLW
jgi:hypothetical protein